MLWRDWRAGELTLLAVALVLAIAALTSVGFLADRLRQGLEHEARQMIGADFIVRADHPVPPAFAKEAQTLGLATATTAVFPSMVGMVEGGGALRLAAVKAVSSDYPLRGALEIAPAIGAPGRQTHSIPLPGTLWADPALLEALHLQVGQTMRVGVRTFTVGAAIIRELDRGFAFVNLSPRVMLRADELSSTGLIGYGSRVTYRLLVAGDPAVVKRFAHYAHTQIDGGKLRGITLESLEDGQPQVRQMLDRARHFFTLVALLTALLAAVAIAMAAQRYMARHLDGCATMRCFGVSRRTLCELFLLEFVVLGIAGGTVGAALGYVGHLALLAELGDLIGVVLPPASWWPALIGIAIGMVLLLGFALPPLVRLTQVPPIRALRRDWAGTAGPAWLGYLWGVVLFAALLVWAAGDLKLGLIVACGFGGGLMVFAALSRLTLTTVARAVRGGRIVRPGWRYAWVSLNRRGWESALQITALAFGLTCLLLVVVIRVDLIEGWRQSIAPDAPNQFLIDIQSEQRQPVAEYLAAHGIRDAMLAPMVRARLVAVNGKPVNPENYHTEDARRLVDREFNLSYTTQLPAGNRIVEGSWYGAADRPQISIEAGLARKIGVKLGDRLRFEVTGLTVDAPVTSVRKLDWGSFKVNFFVLMPTAALHDFPATYITSFYLLPTRQTLLNGLITAYPNLTAIDIAPMLAQLEHMVRQIIAAAQWLFGLTLAAGALVLYTALAGSRDERVREAALLRALGASIRQVRAIQRAEFIGVGVLAGLMAAVVALAVGQALAVLVFDFHLALRPWLMLAGMATGVTCSGIVGWLSLRSVLRTPTFPLLRGL